MIRAATAWSPACACRATSLIWSIGLLLMAASASDAGWQAHWQQGEAAREAEAHARAVGHYRAALAAPDHADISVHMRAAIALGVAESLAGQGDFASADRELGAAIAELPADRARLRALRTALREAEREAQRDWKAGLRWLRRSPQQPWAYESLARALHALGAWPQAGERLDAALGRPLADAELVALFEAGLAHGKAAPVLAAMQSARQQRASPALEAAWIDALLAHGSKQAAVAALAAAAENAPDDATRRLHYRQWLHVLARDNDYVAALEVHRLLLPIGEHVDHLDHARTLVALGRVDDALAAYAEVMRRWPDDPPRDPRSRAGIGENAYWGYLRLHVGRDGGASLVEHLRLVVRPGDCRVPQHLATVAHHLQLPELQRALLAEARSTGCS